jgi:hypothetical protein
MLELQPATSAMDANTSADASRPTHSAGLAGTFTRCGDQTGKPWRRRRRRAYPGQMLPIQSARYRSQFQRDHRISMFRSEALALKLRQPTQPEV